MASSILSDAPMDTATNVHEQEECNRETLQSLAEKNPQNFEDLGILGHLCEKAKRARCTRPTSIQQKAIPRILAGKNLFVCAPSGVGKTVAYVLPLLQAWRVNPCPISAVILTPTRESAERVKQQFEDIGKSLFIECAVIADGGDMYQQQRSLAALPDFVIATPARLKAHLENTSGFTLNSMKYLVVDDVDKMSGPNCGPDIFRFLRSIKGGGTALAFSSEMNPTIYSWRECLGLETLLEDTANDKPVKTLKPYYAFTSFKFKYATLLKVIKKLPKDRIIIFCNTCHSAIEISIKLPWLKRLTLPFHEQMSQEERLSSLEQFKTNSHSILVCTDIASKGLDIPRVDTVISFNIPTFCEEYIDRINAVARAGGAETSVTFITKPDVDVYQRFQQIIGTRRLLFRCNSEVKIDDLMN